MHFITGESSLLIPISLRLIVGPHKSRLLRDLNNIKIMLSNFTKSAKTKMVKM